MGLIHEPNTIQWKPGDLVIHDSDSDAKRADMLMIVLGQDATGVFRTRYAFPWAQPRPWRRKIWRNTVESLTSQRGLGSPCHACASPQTTHFRMTPTINRPRATPHHRQVVKLGRKTRLSEPQRQALWQVFEGVQTRLAAANLMTQARLFTELASNLAQLKHTPFEFVVVDEAQDVSVSQLRMLAAMAGVAPDGSGTVRPNSLFSAGDLGQRIFQQPFSWKALGADVRGRSRTLNINYRTSHQIRQQAARLLGPEVSDMDGNTETRKGTVSVFNGPAPSIESFVDEEAERNGVAVWIRGLLDHGFAAHEIGAIVRSEVQLERASAALDAAGLPHRLLDEHVETAPGEASLCTMHLAKGLEFRAVVVMACDDDVLPLQARIESVMDDADLEEIYNTERHLLYVACTRARDRLMVSSVEPASEFVDDMLR